MTMRALIALLAVGTFLSTGSAASPQLSLNAMAEYLLAERPPPPAEVFADDVCTAPTLLRIANSRSFRRAGWDARVSMIQKWIRRNALEDFRKLDLEGRDDSLRRLANKLDNLLAEKGFRVRRT
jgi:hypothetical protein